MSNPAQPIPEGYHTVTPFLAVDGATRAIEFYVRAFGAIELMRHAEPSGKVRHAEIRIGDSRIMLADEFPELPHWKSPHARGGSTVHLYLYVEDVDAWFERAIAAGAKELMPVADQFYGDRLGGLVDPFGHVWYVATTKEDLSSEELQRRAAAARRA